MSLLKKFLLALLFGVLMPMPALAEDYMTFFMETSQEKRFYALLRDGVFDIYAQGPITEGTTERFLAFIRANKVDMARVHFNSPGGSLLEGMKLGRAIRALGFHTTIGTYNPNFLEGVNKASICASACAYAFVGGTGRFLDSSSGRLGIHQFYSKTNVFSEETTQKVSGLIVAYLDEMGVDAKAFTLSTEADRSGMIWVTPDTALRLRLANNGVMPPVAEIKIANMRPYLRIQQEFHNVTTRVLFICAEKKLYMMFGIVTNPEISSLIMSFPRRSYLELDFEEFLEASAPEGVESEDSVVWINRTITSANLAKLTSATRIDGWVDGSGAVRWGAQLDVPTVRDDIQNFANQCYVS